MSFAMTFLPLFVAACLLGACQSSTSSSRRPATAAALDDCNPNYMRS